MLSVRIIWNMLDKYIEFYYCVKTLKGANLRLVFETPERICIADRETGKEIVQFYSIAELYGFCSCLQLIKSASINV